MAAGGQVGQGLRASRGRWRYSGRDVSRLLVTGMIPGPAEAGGRFSHPLEIKCGHHFECAQTQEKASATFCPPSATWFLRCWARNPVTVNIFRNLLVRNSSVFFLQCWASSPFESFETPLIVWYMVPFHMLFLPVMCFLGGVPGNEGDSDSWYWLSVGCSWCLHHPHAMLSRFFTEMIFFDFSQ